MILNDLEIGEIPAEFKIRHATHNVAGDFDDYLFYNNWEIVAEHNDNGEVVFLAGTYETSLESEAINARIAEIEATAYTSLEMLKKDIDSLADIA